MKILFVSSEAFPLIKTGGLGDVSNSLPNSFAQQGADVRLVLPAYRDVLKKIESYKVLGWLKLGLQQDVRVLECHHDDFNMPIWLIDQPVLFDREGNPYTHPEGYDWQDNPARFNIFSQAAALLATDALNLGWHADVVHANDWQTGLVHAHLGHEANPPKRVFTIHNIAYDCQFDFGTFQALHLPPHWWSMELGEFYDRFSMLKAGMVFSDIITTVSPRYAREIRTPEYGYGYSSILEKYHHKLHGILNGIDTDIWNPEKDAELIKNYKASAKSNTIAKAKTANKLHLLKQLGASDAETCCEKPLVGFVGRLVFQKGIDLLLNAIEILLSKHNACFAIIGSGEHDLEQHLTYLTRQHPQRVFAYIGYSESLAHQLEAGADIFAMPSRYEPCGLNQLYSLRYGTPPVVRNTGGLADTVTQTTDESIKNNTATGFLFDEPSAQSLADTISHALSHYDDKSTWQKIVKNCMNQDYSWDNSATAYLELFDQI